MKTTYAVGVDIGGTKIATALVSSEGDVIADSQVPTAPQRGFQVVAEEIGAEVNRLIARSPGTVKGVGMGVPGWVVPEKGTVYDAVNLGWKEAPLVQAVQKNLSAPLPVQLMKDADASLLGEYHFGAARGCRDFVYLCVGSGLGGAIMANGHPLIGINNSAAGVGHVFLYPEGRICTCGRRGCAETVVSGPGLVTEMRQILAEAGNHSSRKAENVTPAAIVTAALAGDTLARQALSRLACGLGRVMALCVSVLNPALVVLGGGFALAAFDIIVPEAEAEMKQHALLQTFQNLHIVRSGLKSSAIGAASIFWQ